MRAAWLAVAGMMGLGGPIWATSGPAGTVPPSPEAGSELAARWCAACHVVSPSGVGSDAAPSFASIARSRDADYLRDFLARPHGKKAMRGFALSSREIDDVVAYIATLGR